MKWKIYIENYVQMEDYLMNDLQMKEIELGKKLGLDISVYAKPEFNNLQMATIRTGLQKGLDVTEYANPAFDSEQMYLIMYGMCSGVDYKVYSKLDKNGKAVSYR